MKHHFNSLISKIYFDKKFFYIKRFILWSIKSLKDFKSCKKYKKYVRNSSNKIIII